MSDVRLFGDAGMPWQPVSPRLVTARLAVLAALLVVPLLVTVALAVAVSSALWVAVGVVVLVGAWATWVILRQVPAISWLELDDELVVRRGRLFRSLVTVPYGRLQYVDVQSGPLVRALGIACPGGDDQGRPSGAGPTRREGPAARLCRPPQTLGGAQVARRRG